MLMGVMHAAAVNLPVHANGLEVVLDSSSARGAPSHVMTHTVRLLMALETVLSSAPPAVQWVVVMTRRRVGGRLVGHGICMGVLVV